MMLNIRVLIASDEMAKPWEDLMKLSMNVRLPTSEAPKYWITWN